MTKVPMSMTMRRFWALPILLLAHVTEHAVSEGLYAGESHLPASPLWQPLQQALEVGRENSQVTLVYVYARGCGPCRLMEAQVMPQVRPLLEQLALARLDIADHSTRMVVNDAVVTPSAAARKLGIDSTPGFVLLDPVGQPIIRETGLLGARLFGMFLAYATTGAYRFGSFAEYGASKSPPPAESAQGELRGSERSTVP